MCEITSLDNEIEFIEPKQRLSFKSYKCEGFQKLYFWKLFKLRKQLPPDHQPLMTLWSEIVILFIKWGQFLISENLVIRICYPFLNQNQGQS